MAQRFFVPGSHTVDQQLFLNAERSNYLCRVLRLVRGDAIHAGKAGKLAADGGGDAGEA